MRNYTMPGTAERGSGCRMQTSFSRDEYVLAMAYVPWQYFTNVYEPDRALEIGTIFPELDKPFLRGGRGCRK